MVLTFKRDSPLLNQENIFLIHETGLFKGGNRQLYFFIFVHIWIYTFFFGLQVEKTKTIYNFIRN